MSKKMKSVLWIMGGLVCSKALNEILYPLFNSSSTGISPLRAFIPALLSTIFFILCVYKAYQTYKKNDVNVQTTTAYSPPGNDRYERDRFEMLREAQYEKYIGNSKLIALIAFILIALVVWIA